MIWGARWRTHGRAPITRCTTTATGYRRSGCSIGGAETASGSIRAALPAPPRRVGQRKADALLEERAVWTAGAHPAVVAEDLDQEVVVLGEGGLGAIGVVAALGA